MATTDDILTEYTDSTLYIDLETREIAIPKVIRNLGVESDDDVKVLVFSIPRYYGDVDLSEFEIKINYLNAKKEGDMYKVVDMVTGDEDLTFSWTVGRHALAYKGNVIFNVCFKKTEGESEELEVVQEFNTTVATLPVAEGLETGERIVAEYADIIMQWESMLFGLENSIKANIILKGDEVVDAVAGQKDLVEAAGTEQMRLITLKGGEIVDAGQDQVDDVNNAGIEQMRLVTLKGSEVISTIDQLVSAAVAEYMAEHPVATHSFDGTVLTMTTDGGGTTSSDLVGPQGIPGVNAWLSTNTKTGELVHIEDSAELPMQGLTVYGKSTQDGTPTPDAPVPIVSVADDGNVEVTVCGKNLLNILELSNYKDQYARYAIEDGSIKITSQVEANAWHFVTLRTNKKFEVGKRYNISFNYDYSTNGNFISDEIFVMYFDKSATMMSFTKQKSGTTFVVPENTDAIYIQVSMEKESNNPAPKDTVLTVTNLQIEEGEVSTQYEPYKEQTITIPLAEPLRSLPNGVCDELTKDGILRRVGKVVLDGSELWYESTEKGTFYTLEKQDLIFRIYEKNILNDNYIVENPVTSNTNAHERGDLKCCGLIGNYRLYLNNFSFANNINGFLAELQANPVTLIYELAEPIIEPLTAEQQAIMNNLPSMYYPITNVMNDENAEMAVDYALDIKTYVDNKTFVGEPGPQGPSGENGINGVSPILSTSKVGKTTTVTITDVEGVKSFKVLDGADGAGTGDMLASVYDPDGDGVVDKAASVEGSLAITDDTDGNITINIGG